jgi:WD40 repeat protein
VEDVDVGLTCRYGLISVLLSCALFTGVSEPAQAGGKEGAPRTDLHGDPLPERALARSGTTQGRLGITASVLVYSPDGKMLAAATFDHILLLDAKTGKRIEAFPRGRFWPHCIVFTPDRRLLAIGPKIPLPGLPHYPIYLWDVKTSKEVARIDVDESMPGSGAISPDGKLIAVGLWNVRLLDFKTKEELQRFRPHKIGTTSLCFSPDARSLACGEGSEALYVGKPLPGRIKILELSTGQIRRELSGHTGRILALNFSQDGKLLASGAEDNTVRIWDLSANKEIAHLKLTQGFARSVAFSPDGGTLAISCIEALKSGTVLFWDLRTGKYLPE